MPGHVTRPLFSLASQLVGGENAQSLPRVINTQGRGYSSHQQHPLRNRVSTPTGFSWSSVPLNKADMIAISKGFALSALLLPQYPQESMGCITQLLTAIETGVSFFDCAHAVRGNW
ncbi:hypothetical protein [Ruegeria sp. HKCCA4812]|uniref:hypothetical protein n=1 Tax=Ruegeria sp. HKCCA4812 TaxID=2682993 RepID=UPI00148842FC|nr:hypothetical protein [Ruegeria sp. HKCCA4812]